MGKIFYLFGKSACGKDSLYQQLIADPQLQLQPLILYTTRPMREGETDGANYHFTDEAAYRRFAQDGKIIEHRVYETVYGPWHYFLADDGAADIARFDYLAMGTLESYCSVRDYYGQARVVPLYIYVEDGERLIRSVKRQRQEAAPAYEEICRRFLADSRDFAKDKLDALHLERRFENQEFSVCLRAVKEEILKHRDIRESK